MDTMYDVEKNSWCIQSNTESHLPQRSIINMTYPIDLDETAYNYTIYTPVVLAPISKSSTLVLSAYDNDGNLGLRIHDLRLVDDEIVSSITFTLRGNHFQLSKFKNEMNRVADEYRCVGILYFLRKLFYGGFRTIYADKILKPKEYSTLRAAINVVQSSMEDDHGS